AEEDPLNLRGSTNARERATGFANNHRADLVGVPAKGPWRVRIIATDAAGATASIEATRSAATPAGRWSAAGGTGAAPVATRPTNEPKEGEVPLRVLALSQERTGEIATTGIPFPEGVLHDGRRLRLLRVGNVELPLQAEVWSRWPRDGSIRWVLLHVPAECPDLTLEYGRAARAALPKTPLKVTESADVITVETGRARVAVPRRPGVPGGFFVGNTRRGGFPIPVLTTDQGPRLQGRIVRATVERPSLWGESDFGQPLEVVVRVEGEHAAAAPGGPRYPFILRLHAYAGSAAFRLLHTFSNDNTGQEMTAFRSVELFFPGWTAEAAAVADGETRPLPAGTRLFQQEENRFVLERVLPWQPGGQSASDPHAYEGTSAPGWVRCVNGAQVGVVHFWQQYPKSLEARPEGVVVGLMPALPGPIYDGRPEESKLYAYLRGGRYTFRQGFSKTHEVRLDLEGDDEFHNRMEEPLIVAAPPSWYGKGALRALGPLASGWAGYNRTTAANLAALLETRERGREYGLMHFGDWHGERTWNWGNLEYDMAHGLFQQYARTGDRVFFYQADLAARHQRDVDTLHHHADPARVGQQWIHSVHHTAGYYPATYQNMGVYAEKGWSDNRGHVWAQGLFDHAFFTGDRRSWEVARSIADWAAGAQTTNFDFGNAREPGWMLILVMSAYHATADPFYLNAAKLMIERVRAKSRPDEGFYAHDLPRGHCECTPPHRGEAGFMMGVLMTGMKMYYEVTGDERVADDIVKTARFLVKTMWVPEKMGFRYTSCPNTNVTLSSAAIVLEGVAFAARRANDPELAEVCRQALAAALPALSGAGKGMGFYLHSAPQMLAEVAALPGPDFHTYLSTKLAQLRSPARRPYPGILANPNYETGTAGWNARSGFSLNASPDAARTGRLGGRVTGKGAGQNEYVVTVYDTGGADPYEIVGTLVPGKRYRLSVWVKVDRLTPGAPAPTARLTARDAQGSRESFSTNAYDLSRPGTWQRLETIFTVPAYTTRAYVALNTHTRETVEADLSLDDWSLAPVEAAPAEGAIWLAADAAEALLSPEARRVAIPPPFGFQALTGGEGRFVMEVPAAGEYVLWARVAGAGADVAVNDASGVALRSAGGDWEWVRAPQPVRLPAGRVAVHARPLASDGQISRVVLTDER
ncbi:MAG: carbohydrate binding domain-containing protein, partial [Armatimonadota bacterium]|nr:carbohydrate binding domain-containing protein [Armatimonadota bacterium]